MFCEYIIGLLVVASMLMAWFDTPLLVHILHVFRRLGWRKDTDFWEGIPEHETTKEDLDNYLVIYGKYPLLVDLVSCPVCFSFHLAFWTAVVTWLLCTTSFAFFIGLVFSYPILANIIIRIKDKLN